MLPILQHRVIDYALPVAHRKAHTGDIYPEQDLAMPSRRHILTAFAAALLAPQVRIAAAASPTHWVVPFAAGGTTDAAARLLAQGVPEGFGSVIIENRPGASGAIGASSVARARPDGHSALFGGLATNVVLPLTQTGLAYDAEKDLQPVASLCAVDFVLVVAASSKFKTLDDVLQAASLSGNALTFASTGHLGSLHLIMEYLCKLAGVQMLHVPYKGESQGVIDLQEGRVDIAPMSAGLVKSFVAEGRLRTLAALGDQRIGIMPDVPTVAELGFKGFGFPTWNGLFVPSGTPSDALSRLEKAALVAARAPSIVKQLESLGVSSAPKGTAEFTEFLQSERKRWGDIIEVIGGL
ncbi:tripartite tricarboxylate transporter substrate binding protein [Bordetella tumulicola]|uniref:tripartite tricarboxylate transporter substrate binding protein n=1 Tax=Bordetella tumulicola TaxID=1649133 RepID=UPI0039F09F79